MEDVCKDATCLYNMKPLPLSIIYCLTTIVTAMNIYNGETPVLFLSQEHKYVTVFLMVYQHIPS